MLKRDIFKNKDKVLDDIARVAGGAVNVASGLGNNIREDLKTRMDEMGDRLNWVPREDFEALELRVAKLEKQLAETTKPKAKKATAKKPAAKKATTKKSTSKTKT